MTRPHPTKPARPARHMPRPTDTRPGERRQTGTYGVRVRNSGSRQRGAWAAYAQAGRNGAGLSKVELARLLGVDRGTITRWESGQTRPENPDTVLRFAEVLRLDPREALVAAGLLPGPEIPKPTRQESHDDIELRRIRESDLAPDLKRRLIAYVTKRQAEDRRRRAETVREIIEATGGKSINGLEL
jgi:transcriptional regulator with XRE-family HTH domain